MTISKAAKDDTLPFNLHQNAQNAGWRGTNVSVAHISRLEPKFVQGCIPSFFCFRLKHETTWEKRSQLALRRVNSLGMEREHSLSHFFPNLSKALFFALFPICFGSLCDLCTFFREMIPELACFSIAKSLCSLVNP